ncbi:MAG: HEPN domain-containing protein [Candidatus Glassbacteria bacterium]
MSLDPVRIADTRAWLEKARLDIGAGQADMVVDPPFYGDAMFHAQQAAEKALKGFLTWHECPFRKTHDLRELLGQCCEIDSSLQYLQEHADTLTPYAWVFRYPGEPEEPGRDEADEALSLVREIFDAILLRLPVEVRP